MHNESNDFSSQLPPNPAIVHPRELFGEKWEIVVDMLGAIVTADDDKIEAINAIDVNDDLNPSTVMGFLTARMNLGDQTRQTPGLYNDMARACEVYHTFATFKGIELDKQESLCHAISAVVASRSIDDGVFSNADYYWLTLRWNRVFADTFTV